MKKARKLALASVFSALCVVILFIGAIIKTVDLSAAALASLVVMVAYLEIGKGWAFGVYLVASVISILTLPDKTASIVFASFPGFYPIAKELLNKIKPMWLSMTVRIAVFNIFAVVIYTLGKDLLALGVGFQGVEIVLLAMANIVFILYDICIERLAVSYFQRLRPMIFGKR